ncbi:TRAP transporter substrate-binding protein [Devosia sp. YIM 151766]|uniref:TRAP transporter substrate-binding protein n=1 Tax=Devosia sp. YIM 151766 TaxID=3017325 RepID=UPI00255C427D|nr:TRAP transporter substrate-binding protein [Devosia sp. YIM 151766]WIY52389.1 TRAP transporter substrate-binding protein [Devosia sp. YIM 151766]
MSLRNKFLTGLALGMLMLPAGGAVAQELDSVNLKVSGGNRTQNMFRFIEEPFFTQELPEASNGKITATFGSLEDMGIQGPEVLRLLGLGMFDISEGTLSYMAGEAPEFESLDLPGLTGDITEQRKMAEGLREELTQIMAEKFNVKLLTMSPVSLQVLYCNAPISGVDDLAGLKVRTFSRSMAELIEGLGAQSVNIPFAEVVPALDRGVADCAITATSGGNTARWWEVTDHLVILPMGWSMIFFGANSNNWDRLPAETQAFLTEQFAAMEDRMWAQAAADVEDGINCNTAQGECELGIVADRPMTLVELSDADRAKVAEIVSNNVLKHWADRCGADCVANWNEKAGSVIDLQIAAH